MMITIVRLDEFYRGFNTMGLISHISREAIYESDVR